MTFNLARISMRAALAAFGLALALPTWSQAAFPNKQIRIVVGYPAGQTIDTIARSYAAAMSKELGQPIFVDNRAGANGIVGAQEVKRAAADGYTILFASSGQMAINPALYKNLPYNTAADFTPVALIGSGPEYLVANPAFPPNNVKELVALAKTQPGKIDYGSGGIGITAHLTMELFQQQAGIKLNHVPYKGSPRRHPRPDRRPHLADVRRRCRGAAIRRVGQAEAARRLVEDAHAAGAERADFRGARHGRLRGELLGWCVRARRHAARGGRRPQCCDQKGWRPAGRSGSGAQHRLGDGIDDARAVLHVREERAEDMEQGGGRWQRARRVTIFDL